MFRIALFTLLLPGLSHAQDSLPDWVAPMSRVHSRFTGKKGSLALFGDSITRSLAFWASLPHDRKNMDPAARADYDTVSKHILQACWRDWRGPSFGNEGSMTIRWAHDNIDAWLKKLQPETAVILFGTNDLSSVPLAEYEKKLHTVVQKCLDHGTVVILTTLPPRAGMLERSKQFAEAARRVAQQLHVPLCDYHKDILARRPDDWNGADAKFKGFSTYETPTLIAGDGVHPSNPKKYAGDYSREGLASNGYVLRNRVTLASYAAVIRHVLASDRK